MTTGGTMGSTWFNVSPIGLLPISNGFFSLQISFSQNKIIVIYSI